jgi:UDP-3-O-[3-hydroxymyristoyl] glucosamine N-acyltransferase
MAIHLKDITSKLPVIEIIGSFEKIIDQVVGLNKKAFSDRDILWISDSNIDAIKTVDQGTIICSIKGRGHFHDKCTYLVVNNPRLYFLNVVKNFFLEKEEPYISEHSVIDPTVKIGKDVSIKAGVVLEKNCEVGDGTSIDCNSVIKRATIIGKNVKIGANNTIGGEGFGYEKNDAGQFEFIPHIGNVVIEDGVEIGNNTTIDRGVLGSTWIRRNAKIDNLVHIAHGVEVGENSLIIANAMVAGSVVVGENVWIAPSASILNKLQVRTNAVVGMGAVVLKNVAEGQTVVGNPAKDILALRKE